MFRPITITAVLNGWIVQCGCQTVVYQERVDLLDNLNAYMKDPDATEERLVKSGVNRTHTMGILPATAAATRTEQWSAPDRQAYQAGEAPTVRVRPPTAWADQPRTADRATDAEFRDQARQQQSSVGGGAYPTPMTPPHGVTIRD